MRKNTISEYSFREIGKALGISTNTARKAYASGIRKLQLIMGEDVEPWEIF